jgi:hypothetical protein
MSKDKGRWYLFVVGDIFTAKSPPNQRKFAYFYVVISGSSLHMILQQLNP